jgi:hypothetical protein
MKFTIKRAYDNVPYLESDNRIYQIVFSEETYEYLLIFADTEDLIVADVRFDSLIKKAAKKLLEKIEISGSDVKIMTSFYEGVDYLKRTMNEEEDSKKIQRFVKNELMNGSTIDLDVSLKRAFVTDPTGKKVTVKGKEFDSYIDEFSNSPASEDQTLDFSDYLLYKVLTR